MEGNRAKLQLTPLPCSVCRSVKSNARSLLTTRRGGVNLKNSCLFRSMSTQHKPSIPLPSLLPFASLPVAAISYRARSGPSKRSLRTPKILNAHWRPPSPWHAAACIRRVPSANLQLQSDSNPAINGGKWPLNPTKPEWMTCAYFRARRNS